MLDKEKQKYAPFEMGHAIGARVPPARRPARARPAPAALHSGSQCDRMQAHTKARTSLHRRTLGVRSVYDATTISGRCRVSDYAHESFNTNSRASPQRRRRPPEDE
ncbi:hypothetical protein EVAR_85426_1 [Eumeta japonica]|uniref:Uncharacterized protein n=1 Tax=Eumeta variegata TaxID=151549 RepID=A0A4C1WM63_EUMVA|nr:hypothetical protein EVAR_85426_1 [Eumeta japonica]